MVYVCVSCARCRWSKIYLSNFLNRFLLKLVYSIQSIHQTPPQPSFASFCVISVYFSRPLLFHSTSEMHILPCIGFYFTLFNDRFLNWLKINQLWQAYLSVFTFHFEIVNVRSLRTPIPLARQFFKQACFSSHIKNVFTPNYTIYRLIKHFEMRLQRIVHAIFIPN